MHYILLIAVVPFLFFLPGYCIMKKFGRMYDVAERFILSIFLSLALLYGGIFMIEKLAEKIAEGGVALVIVSINIICLVVAFAPVQRIRQKMLRKLRGKDQ